jgi:hypothetical protein
MALILSVNKILTHLLIDDQANMASCFEERKVESPKRPCEHISLLNFRQFKKTKGFFFIGSAR